MLPEFWECMSDSSILACTMLGQSDFIVLQIFFFLSLFFWRCTLLISCARKPLHGASRHDRKQPMKGGWELKVRERAGHNMARVPAKTVYCQHHMKHKQESCDKNNKNAVVRGCTSTLDMYFSVAKATVWKC